MQISKIRMNSLNQESTFLDESMDSAILNRVFDEVTNKNLFKNQPDNPVIDSRFQSYLKFYIADILDSDASRFDSFETSSKKGVLQIDNCFVNKVSICGNIVSIYESEKFYRLKVDDSTGCILVTLWKTIIFSPDSLELSNYANTHGNRSGREQFNDLYNILGSIHKQIKEETINNNIMYEPRQGDLILVKGQIKCYKQNISINAHSCIRLQDSTDELIQIILPSVLNEKVYRISAPTQKQFDALKMSMEFTSSKKEDNKDEFAGNRNFSTSTIRDMEGFLSFVNKKLNEVTSKSADYTLNIQSCKSYSLYNYLRNNCPVEYKFVTHKQVLDALKELEQRGLVYSCEDDAHYLPIN